MKRLCQIFLVLACAASAWAGPLVVEFTTLSAGALPGFAPNVLGAYSTDGGATFTAGLCGDPSTAPVGPAGASLAVNPLDYTTCAYFGGVAEPFQDIVFLAGSSTDPSDWSAVLRLYIQTADLYEVGSVDFNVLAPHLGTNPFFGGSNPIIYVPDPPNFATFTSSSGTEFDVNLGAGVPEPATLLLLGPGFGLLGLLRRRVTPPTY